MKEVVACSGAVHITKNIARKANAGYSELEVKKFPDGELNVRFKKNLKKKRVILVQSFYGNVNDKIIETILAGYTAKNLGAKKVNLLALYFPYFRQDKRFREGEAISIQIISKLFTSAFDKIYFVDPHLHRIHKVKEVFSNGKKISVIPIIVEYLKKLKLKNPVFIGPDKESHQWAREAAKELGDAFIFKKTRRGSRDVSIKKSSNLEKNDVERNDVVILDDIISTGNTMLETVKGIKKLKPKRIFCVGIHGLFVGDSLENLKKYAKVITTNTISSDVSKIDISKIGKEI